MEIENLTRKDKKEDLYEIVDRCVADCAAHDVDGDPGVCRRTPVHEG